MHPAPVNEHAEAVVLEPGASPIGVGEGHEGLSGAIGRDGGQRIAIFRIKIVKLRCVQRKADDLPCGQSRTGVMRAMKWVRLSAISSASSPSAALRNWSVSTRGASSVNPT